MPEKKIFFDQNIWILSDHVFLISNMQHISCRHKFTINRDKQELCILISPYMPVFILNTVSIPWHTVKLTSMHVCIKCIKCRYKLSDKHHIFFIFTGFICNNCKRPCGPYVANKCIITQAHTNISNRLKNSAFTRDW